MAKNRLSMWGTSIPRPSRGRLPHNPNRIDRINRAEIHVLGTVGVSKVDGQWQVAGGVANPDARPVVLTRVSSCYTREWIFTDGEVWLKESSRWRTSSSSNFTRYLVQAHIAPNIQGFIKEAIRAYIAGKGNHLCWSGRHMTIDRVEGLLINSEITQLEGTND